MSIESIAAISAGTRTDQWLNGAAAAPAGSFSAALEAVSTLNDQMHTNSQAVQSLALGDTDNLHRVMMQLEQTRLTFDLMLQVRGKVLEAYQELMRMQV